MSYLQRADEGATFLPFTHLRDVFGFVPNLFRAETLLPRVIEAQAGLAATVLTAKGALSRTQKELIALVIAAAKQSPYWFTQHRRTLGSLGVPDHQLDEVVADYRQAGLSPPETFMLDFAVKLATRAAWLSEEDVTAVRNHGFSDHSILEAVLVTGLTSFFCTLDRGLGPAADFE